MQEMQELWVWLLDWADFLEYEMATHSSMFAQKTTWIGEPGELYNP